MSDTVPLKLRWGHKNLAALQAPWALLNPSPARPAKTGFQSLLVNVVSVVWLAKVSSIVRVDFRGQGGSDDSDFRGVAWPQPQAHVVAQSQAFILDFRGLLFKHFGRSRAKDFVTIFFVMNF